MNEVKNQINDLEHKETKNNQPEQQEEIRESKNVRVVSAASGTISSGATFAS